VAAKTSRLIMSERQQIEIRSYADFADEAHELRIEHDDNKAHLVGYAVRFNTLSEDLGGFRERIMPGALTKTIQSGRDIRALVDHDHAKILGRTSAGTLELSVDEMGLRFQVTLPDTQYARDTQSLVERGDIRGMSFGFLVPKGAERFITEGGARVRELLEIDLREITVTSIPAYPAASVTVRSNAARGTRSIDVARRQLEVERLLGRIV